MDLGTLKILEYDEKYRDYIIEIDGKIERVPKEQIEYFVEAIIELKLKALLGNTNLYCYGEIKKIFDYTLECLKWQRLEGEE